MKFNKKMLETFVKVIRDAGCVAYSESVTTDALKASLKSLWVIFEKDDLKTYPEVYKNVLTDKNGVAYIDDNGVWHNAVFSGFNVKAWLELPEYKD